VQGAGKGGCDQSGASINQPSGAHAMKFKAMMHGREITGEVVNAGEWFGKAWVVEIGIGMSSFFKAVEANSVGGAIDALTDSDEHGAYIRMVDEDTPDEDVIRAGNAGEPVDLENVIVHGQAFPDHRMDAKSIPYNAKPGCSDIVYLIGEAPTLALTPIQYMNTCVWDQH
jgi:hypothetical protein